MLRLKSKDDSFSIDLNQSRINIGRDSDNDLVIDDIRASGFHPCIFAEGGRIELTDLGSSNGTTLNNKEVLGRVPLKAWDVLQIGDTELEVVNTEQRRPTVVQAAISDAQLATHILSEQQKDPVAILRLVSPSGCPPELAVAGRATIGREGGNTFNLGVATVSANHAELTVVGDEVSVADLNSANGTYVNGERISRRLLRFGDRVRFDEIEYAVETPYGRRGATVLNPAVRMRGIQQPAKDEVVTRIPSGLSDHDEAMEWPEPAALLGDAEPQVTRQEPAVDLGWQAEPAPVVNGEMVAHSVSTVPGDEPVNASGRGLGWLLFSAGGRLRRLPYLFTAMIFGVVSMIPVIVAMSQVTLVPHSNMVTMLQAVASVRLALVLWLGYWLFAIWPINAIAIKRLHDLNVSGWWVLVYWIPLVGTAFATMGMISFQLVQISNIASAIFGFVLVLAPGTKGPNRFGQPVEQIF